VHLIVFKLYDAEISVCLCTGYCNEQLEKVIDKKLEKQN